MALFGKTTTHGGKQQTAAEIRAAQDAANQQSRNPRDVKKAAKKAEKGK